MFEGRSGTASLLDLSENRGQLVICHFMPGPGWDEGCRSCSFLAGSIGHLTRHHARHTTLALVSQAPLGQVELSRAELGRADQV